MKFAILGTVGVPGSYGGFETLAENLVRFHHASARDEKLSVYCSTQAFDTYPSMYLNAELRYIKLNANGPQSMPYDMLSLFDAVWRRADVIVLLGVSGALALPLIRAVSRTRVLTNIDGIEWKREKWRGLARFILRLSELTAVKWSHAVIADNAAIAEHVRDVYGSDCHVIAYGGDHALVAEPVADHELKLPAAYALGLCRIEPENNISMILEAFSRMPSQLLVFVGNWDKSEYGRELKARYRHHENIYLVGPIYDAGRLRWIRNSASAYVHGHSAGGTNPSLVEMMHFGIPIFAHGCNFNRYTTENRATYFNTAGDLISEIGSITDLRKKQISQSMLEIARRRYTWNHIGRAYFDLINEK